MTADVGDERFDVVYLMVSGTTTAARCPEILRGLLDLGYSTVIAIPTPNASRTLAPREMADPYFFENVVRVHRWPGRCWCLHARDGDGT